jgi:AcrR family transcriptional regulator
VSTTTSATEEDAMTGATEGLRERKKRRTRESLAANAQRMFRERGFDQVTVAEIAAASDVSVKTLFVYFASKEDLVFADELSLLDEIRERLTGRPAGTAALAAVRGLAHDLIGAAGADDDDGLTSFTRLVGDNPTLHARLQLMWERYEQGLADTLAAEAGGSPLDPRIRTAAAMLVTPFRVLTSSDVRGRLADDDTATWVDACFGLLDTGLSTGDSP